MQDRQNTRVESIGLENNGLDFVWVARLRISCYVFVCPLADVVVSAAVIWSCVLLSLPLRYFQL